MFAQVEATNSVAPGKPILSIVVDLQAQLTTTFSVIVVQWMHGSDTIGYATKLTLDGPLFLLDEMVVLAEMRFHGLDLSANRSVAERKSCSRINKSAPAK
jgi:hypothetical protein